MRATGPSTPAATTTHVGAPAPRIPAIRGVCQVPLRPPCPALPAEAGRSVRLMRRRLPFPDLPTVSQSLLAYPHMIPKVQAGAQAWVTRIFGTHETRGWALPGSAATRGTILRCT